MNVFRLAWSYLRARPLGTMLNVLLLGIGIATIGFVRIVDREVGDNLNRDAQGIDLVVGAKGSPIQLILSAVYQLDVPTGNVPLAAMEKLERDPRVRSVVPISLGDSFGAYRIVGTTPDYVAMYGGALASGRMWNDALESVIGATVAERGGLKLGGRFVGSHGLAPGGPVHGDSVYTVVGVLNPTGTVLDRLVLVNTPSVWQVHEGRISDPDELEVMKQEREVTALLIRYATPLAAVTLPRYINTETNMQAASPAFESARLFRLIGVGADVIRAFGGVVLATAALSLFIALYHALAERAYDIAVLRTLGARPSSIALMMMVEALMLAMLGGVLGLALAHGLVALLVAWIGEQESVRLSALSFSADELWLLVPSFVAAALAALLPAWRAAHADISATLARRN